MSKVKPVEKKTYKHFLPIPTRWHDNDIYGHVNNVVYYAFFDTAVNTYLIQENVLDIHHGDTIGLVIETHCNYFAPITFPQTITAGIKVTKIGTSSVRYEIGLFEETKEEPIAQGHFVHVYVDKETRRPVPLRPDFRETLENIYTK